MVAESAPYSLPPHISNRLDEAVFSSRPLAEVLNLVLDAALELSRAQYGSLRWVNRRENSLELKAQRAVCDAPRLTPEAQRDSELMVTSIMAEVLTRKVPVLVPDLRTASWQGKAYALPPSTPMLSALAVPLLSNDGTVVTGMLYVGSLERHAFTPVDQDHLCALARRAQMFVQQVSLSAAIKTLSQKALSEDVDAVLAYMVEALADLLYVPYCGVWLLDPSDDHLVLTQVVGKPQDAPSLPHIRIPMTSFLGRALAGTEPLYAPDVLQEPDFLRREMAKKAQWRSALAVPIRAATGIPLGVTVVYSVEHERNFTPQDRSLAISFSNHAAMVFQQVQILKNQQRYARQRSVTNDILTASLSTEDIDVLLDKATRWIGETLGYKVDLYLLEHGQLVSKVIRLYDGTILPNTTILSLDQGLTSLVARTKTPQVIPDVHDTELPYYRGDAKTRSELAVPLVNRAGEAIGVLNVESPLANTFSAEDIQFFQPIASGLALAIANAQRLKEHEALRQISRIVTDATDLESIFAKTFTMLLALFEAHAASLYLADLDADSITRVWQQGLPKTMYQRMHTLKAGQSITGTVLKDGVSLVTRDMVSDPRMQGMVTEEDGLRALMSVPIKTENAVLGVLNVLTRDERFFTNHDVELLELIGHQLGRALEKAQWAEKYQRLYQEARDPIFILKPGGDISDANRQAREITGHTLAELQHRNLKDLIVDTDLKEQAHVRLQRLVKGEDVEPISFQIKSKTGSLVMVESNLTRIHDPRGTLVAVEAIWRDITARNLAAAAVERRNRQLNTLLKLSRTAVHPAAHQDLVSQVAEGILTILESDRCLVHRLQEDSGAMDVLNFPPTTGTQTGYLNEGFIRHVVSIKRYRMVNYIPVQHESSQLAQNLGQPRHVLSMPIKSSEHVLGVISVVRYGAQTPPYTRSDKDYLELLANILSLDLEHQRLAETQARQQAASTTLQQVSMLGGFLAHKIPNVLGTVAWAAKTLDTLIQPPRREHNTLLMESLRASGQQAERLIAQCRSLGRPLYLRPETTPLAPLVLGALGHVTKPLSVKLHQELRSLPAVKVNPTLFRAFS